MSPAERRAAENSKVQQQLQAKQSKEKAENKKEEDTQRIDFDKAKLKQRKKEFKAREKERKQVNKRMNKALELKQSEQDRKLQKRKDAAEDKKRDKLKKDVKNAQKAVDDRTNKMKKLEVGFDNVEKDDGLGTAFSKFGGNMTQLAQKTARGTTGFLKREIKDRPALRRAKRELKNFENPPKKKPKVGSVTIDRSSAKADDKKVSQVKQKKVETKPQQKLLPGRKDPERKALPAAKSAPERKALPAARSPERKALPAAKSAPERKALPAAKEKGTYVGKKYTITQGRSKGGPLAKKPDGGAGSLTRAVDKANNLRAAKRAQTTTSSDYASKADRIAAFKKKRAEQKAAGVKMREEFLQEVEKMKKEKVDKVINVMRGKNKIETMPKVSESKDWRDGYKPLEFETIDLIKPEPLKASNWRNEISEEGKKIISINKEKRLDAKKQAFKDMIGEPYETDDKKRKEYGKKLLDRLTKVDEGAAWTKKEGKNKSGGLNEKGRKSYERENPGSDLKAPSKKVGNPRRKSFCARMKGMKKKLTSSKTANDPDSRINKSLRAWNC